MENYKCKICNKDAKTGIGLYMVNNTGFWTYYCSRACRNEENKRA